MAKLSLVKGSTSQTVNVMIYDSSVSTGAGLTGLAFNTGSLVASYVRPRAARTAITLATQTVTGAYSSGGFVEVDATNTPGLYRLDVPDAALATGVNAVVIMLKGASNMSPCVFEIELTGVDNQDATAFGLSRIDAAITSRLAPTVAARTLDVSAGGEAGLDWANVGSPTTSLGLTGTTISTSQVAASVTAGVTVTTNNDKTGYGLSAAAVQAIWDALTSALTAVGSVGKAIADNLTGNAYTRLGAPVGASISADIAGVQADTDNMQTRLPAALVSGRIDASVGAMATDTLTATALATSAVTEIQTGLSTLTAAQVNTEVVDALSIDTYAELSGVPAATSSLKDKLNWLFILARNKRTTSSTTDTVRNDADSGTVATSTVSDDGTTFTRGEYS